jgi:DNA-binding response OmpR family regulator
MQKKILVIEDDLNVRSNLRDLLEEAGYQVTLANDGNEGIIAAKTSPPDLILCDIMMPKSNGYKVKSNLSKSNSTIDIPFIFLTAKSTIDDMRKGMLTGADDYVVKPYRAKELLETIKVRLRRKEEIRGKLLINKETEQNKFAYNGRILITVKNQSFFINISEILSIIALSEYTQLELNDGSKYIIRKLLKEWEDLLPDHEFIRIHRSTIVNINGINKIESWYKRSMKITMKYSEKEFIVSQRYTAKIKSNLGL